jgi:NitT/TauT family transport system permease protein
LLKELTFDGGGGHRIMPDARQAVAAGMRGDVGDTFSDRCRDLVSGAPARIFTRLALFAVILAAWQFLPSPAGRFWISDPISIGEVLLDWIGDGTLLRNVLATMEVMVAGYAVGCALGIAFGLIFGLVRPLDRVLSPFVFAIYSLPKIALIPLLIILCGIGFVSKFVLVTLVVFFMLFSSTIDGVRNIDSDVALALRLMGATHGEVTRKMLVPAIQPWIFTSMRVAVNTAFSNTLLAELLTANSGIGFLIVKSSSQYDAAGTYAAVLVLVGVSVVITELLSQVEQRMTAW